MIKILKIEKGWNGWGEKNQETRFKKQGTRCWMLDAGCWMLDAGCWIIILIDYKKHIP
jgi:hypothetical protein